MQHLLNVRSFGNTQTRDSSALDREMFPRTSTGKEGLEKMETMVQRNMEEVKDRVSVEGGSREVSKQVRHAEL